MDPLLYTDDPKEGMTFLNVRASIRNCPNCGLVVHAHIGSSVFAFDSRVFHLSWDRGAGTVPPN